MADFRHLKTFMFDEFCSTHFEIWLCHNRLNLLVVKFYFVQCFHMHRDFTTFGLSMKLVFGKRVKFSPLTCVWRELACTWCKHFCKHFFSFYPLAFQAEAEGVIVVACVCPSVRLSVRLSVNFTLCPHDNSSQIWVGITKFAPNMRHWIRLVGIENRGHWPWPSRSFWPFCIRFLGILAYPHNKSS